MEKSGVYLSRAYEGAQSPVILSDAEGEVNVYSLPFIKPSIVRAVHGEDVSDYTEAVALAIREMKIDPAARNILVAHQFIVGSERSASEEISVGGTDGVDVAVLSAFDYVALGHLHAPQRIGAPHIRYAGSPLKYSFSEEHHQKSVTAVTLGKKGECDIRLIPLIPLREMRTLRGAYGALMDRASYEGTSLVTDYLRIILTDKEDVPDAAARLRTVYRGLLQLEYDNKRTRELLHPDAPSAVDERSPLALFEELYEIQNNRPVTEAQRKIVSDLIDEIWSEDE
jgi:exonuclease SbcD